MIRDFILASCKAYPDRIALTIGERQWTYAELEDTARRWASRLMDATDGQPQRAAVFGYRSETSYLGVLACLFAGAAFVPLNPRFPLERTVRMIEMAGLDALFVDSDALPLAEKVQSQLSRPLATLAPANDIADAQGVTFDRKSMAAAAPVSGVPKSKADNLAYLLFTSGSTGRPKGVPITHANLTSFIKTNLNRYEFGPNDRFSQTFDQTFDLSIFDLFMAWASGARVCSMQPLQLLAPASFVAKNEVTVWFSVPSLANMAQNNKFLKPNSMPALRWSLFCGEALPLTTAEAWQRAAPNSIVENLYGPTELTIACAAYRWHPALSPSESIRGFVPVGKVYPGLTARLIDAQLQPVSEGEPGELCVAGPQAFAGYWGDPEQTEKQTVILKEPDGRLQRYYRTGDLMQPLPSGNLAFLGRQDHQIKLRGFRIELFEIEAALRQAGCIEAVALPWPDPLQPESIKALVLGPEEPSALADRVRELLPPYMVPEEIRVLDSMPLNTNGKVDRHALLEVLKNHN
jgi:amino acid adenylation domain-containing protein